MMKKNVFSLMIIVSLFSLLSLSGCALLLVGAAGMVVHKVATSAPGLSKGDERAMEIRMINGSQDAVFNNIQEILESENFDIGHVDYKKYEIEAKQKNTGLIFSGSIKESSKNNLEVKTIFKNENGIVENKKLYGDFFDKVLDKIKTSSAEEK